MTGLVRWGYGLVLLAALVATFVVRTAQPGWVLALVGCAWVPWRSAWRGTAGTALRPSVVWAAVAIVLATLGQVAAFGEPASEGRPWMGHWTYLACLATLASLVSVLNARRPGAGAWAWLMGLLVLVLLIPWLEGSGRTTLAHERLRLEMPWSLFFGLLVLVGVSNFLPTRFGLGAAVAGVGLVLELYALATGHGEHGPGRAHAWSLVVCALAAGPALAYVLAPRPAPAHTDASARLERLWGWFRDRWGVVWGLRVLERFQREANLAGWSFRLTWTGVISNAGNAGVPPEELAAAEAILRGLLHRFAEPWRLEAAAREGR
jgi:hypothetical protein